VIAGFLMFPAKILYHSRDIFLLLLLQFC